jgi:hypothetical protein
MYSEIVWFPQYLLSLLRYPKLRCKGSAPARLARDSEHKVLSVRFPISWILMFFYHKASWLGDFGTVMKKIQKLFVLVMILKFVRRNF